MICISLVLLFLLHFLKLKIQQTEYQHNLAMIKLNVQTDRKSEVLKTIFNYLWLNCPQIKDKNIKRCKVVVICHFVAKCASDSQSLL